MFRVEVSSNIKPFLEGERTRLAVAITGAVNRVAEWLKGELRAQVAAADLGDGLQKAWQSVSYPRRKPSLRPAALVFSKARRIHQAFDLGFEVRARRAKWLVIPLEAAEAMGFGTRAMGRKDSERSRRARWSEVEAALARYGDKKSGLRFVEFAPGKALLVADGLSKARQRTVRRKLTGAGQNRAANRVSGSIPLFLLLKRARGAKRLDIRGAEARALERLAGEVNAAVNSVE